MQTDDGELWMLETAALSSRHHPLSHVVYSYQVEDSDGKVLRKEWNLVPRIYHFDGSKDFLFPDLWRDRPLAYHLYSNAYLTTVGGRRDEVVEAAPIPLYRRSVVFRVSAPQLLPGQAVAVCGSHPAIGSWNPTRYLPMQYMGQHEWMLSVNALGWLFPVEYKYVVYDKETHALVQWEEGDNRTIGDGGWLLGDSEGHPTDVMHHQLSDGQVLVLYGQPLRLCEAAWRIAGVAIPVFSLRSEHSYGVGDFGDLRRLVDWAVATGMKMIQLLPVNDTTTNHLWGDSCPYNVVSCFALHPHYVDLEAAGTLHDKQKQTLFLRRRQELNALPYSDYEAVDRVKNEYLEALFSEQGHTVMGSKEFKEFVAQNEGWLKPYAAFLERSENSELSESSEHSDYTYYIQYLLHSQLQAAADYARSKGVALMGDLPVGINRDSDMTREHPELFHLDAQAGTPPDASCREGQNWGMPTYHWSDELCGMLKQRIGQMAHYFDALRIDHVLGYFCIWEIPTDAVSGVLGHFSPSLPLTVEEIEYFGLHFRHELFTHPFINDRQLDRLFGIHANYVREHFLEAKAYNLYELKEEYHSQRLIAACFDGRHDENSLWIRDGLMQLAANVLFVEDLRQKDMYHPRIGAIYDPVFDILSSEEKDAYMRLYNNYFGQRHSFFWGQHAMQRLTAMLDGSRMLACAEDLGMLPDCVEPVLDELRIFTTEVQQLPKQQGFEFAHLDANPTRSLCTISTHDMAPLRLWWQENPDRRQRYYVTMLQKEGRAPEQLPAHLAEEIIARHLYCPSMVCMLSLQDWLSMDTMLRCKQPQQERINVPADAYNRWKYRMHLTIEELLDAEKYNNKVRTMILRSKR